MYKDNMDSIYLTYKTILQIIMDTCRYKYKNMHAIRNIKFEIMIS